MSQDSYLDRVVNEDSDSRFDFFIEQVITDGKLWIIHDDQGFVVLTDDEQESIPVWATEAHAKQWLTDDWAECTTKEISLEHWFERWTAGLEQDNIHVAVFPNLEGESLVLSAEDLAEELASE